MNTWTSSIEYPLGPLLESPNNNIIKGKRIFKTTRHRNRNAR